MKLLTFLFLLSLIACDQNSSPEGRMSLKLDGIQKKLDSLNNYDHIQQQIDSLKEQNAIMNDTIDKIKQELKNLKSQK